MDAGLTINPTFDYYANAEAWIRYGTTTLIDLIDGIRGDEFAERIAAIRAHYQAGNIDAANDLKKKLPAVSLSGTCTGRRAKAVAEDRFTHSGLLQIDLDAKDNPEWTVPQMRGMLESLPFMLAVFVSASGCGVKGIARCVADPAKHLGCFLAAQRHFADFDLKIDPACKDPVRLAFVSHDPDAWINPNPRGMFEPDPEPQELPATNGAQVNGHNGHSLTIPGNSYSMPLTSDVIREMLACIDYPGYSEWLKIFNAVISEVGVDEAIRLCNERWPEKHAGDYAKHAQHPLSNVTRGTLIWHATQNGWRPAKELRLEYRSTRQLERIVAMSGDDAIGDNGKTMPKIDPLDLFYDASNNSYLVRTRGPYLTFHKRSVVLNGVKQFLAPNYKKAVELTAAANAAIDLRELSGCVQWSGPIAGHAKGHAHDANTLPILVTAEAMLPEPQPGDCPFLLGVLSDAFSDPDAFAVFVSWLAIRYNAVRTHTHIPSPMLVLSGEINSGKSLLAWIVGEMLGGRMANPYAIWSGAIVWNDDLIGSELLLMDDCTGSTDIRSRRNFGAAFKEAIYPPMVQLRKRHCTSIMVRPVWGCMVCCNDTPEALQVIPPLDADMHDKISLLHVSHVNVPFATNTPEGIEQWRAVLRGEFPAFAQMLLEWQVPEHLIDSRAGIVAWRDPQLAQALDEHSPARRLEDLLVTAIGNRAIWFDLPREMSASEIESRLLEPGSLVRDQARALFSWGGACGSAAIKLARMENRVVSLGGYDTHRQRQLYWVRHAV